MFVVMSGLPGSGKTTLGRQLGAALGLDVLDKDDFLEAHFADYAEIDSTLRSTLSRLADAELQERALSALRPCSCRFGVVSRSQAQRVRRRND